MGLKRRLVRWWKTLCWFGCVLRCKVRRRHGEPLILAKAPVRTRGRRKRVAAAGKTVCSECFVAIELTTNREWRRAALKPRR